MIGGDERHTMTTPIRDRTGRVVGYIDDQPNRLQLRDRTGKVQGWYNKNDDKTYYRTGNLQGFGNQLIRLLN
jgi:hypothetical protein